VELPSVSNDNYSPFAKYDQEIFRSNTSTPLTIQKQKTKHGKQNSSSVRNSFIYFFENKRKVP